MEDQERTKPEPDRVQDLEVQEDEARDIAGGREVTGLDAESEVTEHK